MMFPLKVPFENYRPQKPSSKDTVQNEVVLPPTS